MMEGVRADGGTFAPRRVTNPGARKVHLMWKLRGAWKILFVLAGMVFGLAHSPVAQGAIPAGSAVTYQGRLVNNGVPYDGSADIRATLFDAESGGIAVGGPIDIKDVAVTNGLFTVSMDFSFNAYTSDARWLGIEVRAPHDASDTQPFTVLTPRQALAATPFALQTKGIHVDHATGFVGVGRKSPLAVSELLGLYHGGPGLRGMFIQTEANGFPYYGYSTPGGGGFHYFQDSDDSWRLSTNGVERLRARADGAVSASVFDAAVSFTINNAHALSMAGTGNLFAGNSAGQSNNGINNTYVGDSAGGNSSNGDDNSFLGYQSGVENNDGDRNSYFGSQAGYSNASGTRNCMFGWAAGYENLASNNAFFGPETGRSNTTGTQNAFFARSGFANTTGSRNSFFGYASGFDNSTASDNSFLGYEAGRLNTIGEGNVFLGARAGRDNLDGGNNTFVGTDAGHDNTATGNSFFGRSAGFANTSGVDNSFFGLDAGRFNTLGKENSFFGAQAGYSNVDGNNNSFFGENAGRNNTSGFSNSFFGFFSGLSNTTGDGNSFFGLSAGLTNTTGNLNTAIGLEAGNALVNGDFNAIVGARSGRGITHGNSNSVLGFLAGESIGSADENVYLGFQSGRTATGSFNTFVGADSGNGPTTGDSNTFVGWGAGLGVDTGYNNTYIGRSSGGVNADGFENVAVGYFSDTSGTGNTAVGARAAVNNGVNYCAAIGFDAQCFNQNSVVLGRSTDTVRIPGNLIVTGSVSKGGGSFRIDHPLDPENKWLYHSFVESPDMMNVYNGNVTTDGEGRAVVELPDYFEALNRDFRYQLTVIGQFAQAIVSKKVENNRFVIQTDKPGVEVSWQVTGIRKDTWANEHRVPVEQAKSDRDREGLVAATSE